MNLSLRIDSRNSSIRCMAHGCIGLYAVRKVWDVFYVSNSCNFL